MYRLCVIGDPVAHSRSPAIHTALLRQRGLEGIYTTVTVREGELEAFVAEARRGKWDGFNVTMPHKQAILPLLDAVEGDVAAMGAVNTVVVRQGRAVGYNTDGEGFVRSLPFTASGKRVLVLGSMPGVASLNARQYYAHPRNAFWPVMYALWGETPPAEYEKRLEFLKAHRVALWDVAAACFREGSLDSGIRNARPNDFAALFAACPEIRAVFFNGQAAWTLYHRLCPELGGGAARTRLPSTSPAYTMPFEQKLAAWRVVRLAAEGEEKSI